MEDSLGSGTWGVCAGGYESEDSTGSETGGVSVDEVEEMGTEKWGAELGIEEVKESGY